jgi:hypothetical protein
MEFFFEPTVERKEMLTRHLFAGKTALYRALVLMLGLFFLLSSISKASDIGLFMRQIEAYGIIHGDGIILFTAWSVVSVEWVLAMGLVFFYRPRTVLALSGLLLTAFTGLLFWAWLSGAVEDCGCFGGWMKQAPGQKLIFNGILLLLTALAWKASSKESTSFSHSYPRAKTWATVVTAIAGVWLTGLLASEQPLPSQTQAAPPVTSLKLCQTRIQGVEHLDLSLGSYLVVLMGTDCQHCQEVVPSINMLTEELPGTMVIALCPNEQEERMAFAETFQPRFPLGQISEETFWDLLAEGSTPRFLLVNNGVIQKVWNKTPPGKDELEAS